MRLTLLTLSMLCNASVAWDVDKRCPDWRNGRNLHDIGGFDTQDADFDPDAYGMKQRASSSLRGAHEQSHRELAFSFQLKMYWEQGFCWQEEWKERKWCMSCQGRCSSGERLWIQYCTSGDATQKFNYIPAAGGGGQLKTATENLCLERVSGSSYKLADCQVTDRQIFTGFETNGSPFELHPKSSSDTCMANQFHHPKPEELIFGSTCKDARINHTDKWQVYNGGTEVSSPSSAVDTSTLRLRNKECSDNDNCDACEGDCDSDKQCKGNLKCFQRNNDREVPGCNGAGISGRDYCYEGTTTSSKTQTSSTVMTNIFGRLSGPGCSKSRPCGVCEGDCDSNDECAGNLICYQKPGPGSVPGCSGYDISNTDFCVPP
jgi:hypothetical protein